MTFEFDNHTFRVFSSIYVDWGLEICDNEGNELFYSASCLSIESFGFHWENDEGEPLDEGIDWSEAEWCAAIAAHAWDFLDAYCHN